MDYTSKNLFHYIRNPIWLSVGSLLLFTLLILGFLLLRSMGEIALDRMPWLLSASVSLMYSIFSAVFFFFAEDVIRYWQKSIYSYLGLALITGLCAWMITGLSLSDIDNFRSILFVLALAYITFMIIVTTVRRLVEYSRTKDREKLAREYPDSEDKNS